MQQIYGQKSISVPVGSYLIIVILLLVPQRHVNSNFSFSMMHTKLMLSYQMSSDPPSGLVVGVKLYY